MSRLEDLRQKGVEFKSDLVKSMWAQGPNLPDGFLAALKEYVGDCETYATEYELYEELEHPDGEELFFKGYIDAVLKTKDGKSYFKSPIKFKKSSTISINFGLSDKNSFVNP